jgi:hypothetical protein
MLNNELMPQDLESMVILREPKDLGPAMAPSTLAQILRRRAQDDNMRRRAFTAVRHARHW